MTSLPNKPSELILLALSDLAEVEARPNVYTVNMSVWHNGEDLKRCLVCFAGAVIAGTLGAKPYEKTSPHRFPDDDNKLQALDLFRVGAVLDGLEIMGLQCPESFIIKWWYRQIIPYHVSPVLFRTDMTTLAKSLAEAGL